MFDRVKLLFCKLYGLLFVIGLMGSGKIMMFYLVIEFIKFVSCNIVIVEDLVEY